MMTEANIKLLEGAQYRVTVTLKDEQGRALDPALFRVYAGASCPGFAPAPCRATHTDAAWDITIPGLSAGRVPWCWQLMVCERATAVEWLVAAGDITVIPRHAAGAGYLDPGELNLTATLDKETLNMTVTVGDSTAAVIVAAQHAAESAASAAHSASAAENSATTAGGHQNAAERAAERAEQQRRDAAASAAAAAAAEQAAEQSKQSAAGNAASAATSEQAAARAAAAAKLSEDAAADAIRQGVQDAGQSAAAAAASAAAAKRSEEGAAAAVQGAVDAAAASAAVAHTNAQDAAASAEAAADTIRSGTDAATESIRLAALETARARQAADAAAASADFAREHAANDVYHVTAAEHQHLRRLIDNFPEVSPDAPTTVQPSIPAAALPWAEIERHFAQHAQPGVSMAPGHVFVSRVPWASWDAASSSWKNNASAVDEVVMETARKFMDNAGLKHAQSTDSTEGADDYIGKQWAFYCARCNYETDDHGIKHITAVEGFTLNGAVFSTEKNVGAFGPAFWYFCKTESYQAEDGTWATHDGTADGVPLFQLWGISDQPWAELDTSRRAELAAHGVGESDFSLWPECQVYSAEDGVLLPRPYWVHSAYCGGYERDTQGNTKHSSKPNLPLYKNLSYQSLNSLYGYARSSGGGACVQGFGILFDIVKNATKNSQSLHYGMANNNASAVKAAVSTAVADYVFPIASAGTFEPGCTVFVWQTASGSDATPLTFNKTRQAGRVKAIETRRLLLADGTEKDQLCLVFEPGTMQPFLVRTGDDNAAAIAAAKSLSDTGVCCHCFATKGQALSGETDAVRGKHDGSRYSNTNGRHPYRVQLTEYMPGAWICAADTVAVKGNGTTAVEINGEMQVPPATQYVILTAPPAVARRSSGTLQQFMDSGYVPVGLSPASGSYIVNAVMAPRLGVVHPVGTGGTGSGTGTGHADNMWVGASPAEFLCGGSLNHAADAGSAALSLVGALGFSTWSFAARD